MPTVFKNQLTASLGTVETSVFTSSVGVKTTVVGISLTNLTDSIVLASIRINDNVNSKSAYYSKNTIIPPNQSLRVVNGGERLILGDDTDIMVQANTAASLDCVLSYVEIS